MQHTQNDTGWLLLMFWSLIKRTKINCASLDRLISYSSSSFISSTPSSKSSSSEVEAALAFFGEAGPSFEAASVSLGLLTGVR